MKLINSIMTHKASILSVLLVAAAAVLGADGSFAMAVDPVETAAAPNPGGEGTRGDLPGGMENRPADEKPKADLTGTLKTELPNKAATATDVRDAGLEAEDYDRDVVLFNKFKYASETILASKVKPIKVNSYVVEHFRVGQPDLDAVYTAPSSSVPSIAFGTKTLSLPVSAFTNPDALTEYATVIVEGIEGYTKDAGGNQIVDGSLQLFVKDHKDSSSNIVFEVVNGPAVSGTSISFTASTSYKFIVCATAASETQMRVAPVTFLPEKTPAILQKKIASAIITDAFKEQAKKTPLGISDVIKYTTDIFKRQCARSHWLGQEGRVDVKNPKTGNREAAYMEKGILRQIPSIYTHGASLANADLMAISSMMFTEWAQSDRATAFVGKREMKRIMALVNSSTQWKDVSKPEVNDYGIVVRKYTDNFGQIEFIYDQTLDELGYEDYMVILDLSSMVRYYMRDDKVQSQDMKKTGDAMEAEAWNISRIDCYCLKGGNALIVCPASAATTASKLGGITAYFTKTTGSESALSDLTITNKYYLVANLGGFVAGNLIEYNAELAAWQLYEGRIFA